MTDFQLVGDIGGTNARLGLVRRGTTNINDIETFKNEQFSSLESIISHFLLKRNITKLKAAAIAVAGPVSGDSITLTNRNWRFTRDSLCHASLAQDFLLLNDFEALAWSLPSLGTDDLIQIGGQSPKKASVKVVLGPGTGLGMSILVPLPQGGSMVLPGELGHITLPIAEEHEFALQQKMSQKGSVFEVEDVLTGSGILRLYQALATKPTLATPEAVLQAALQSQDQDAGRAIDYFIVFLARLSGDIAMALQAHGGVYLGGGIVPSLTEKLQTGVFRQIFQEKGRMAYIMHPIPVYIIIDPFPALKGCAAALYAIGDKQCAIKEPTSY